MKHVSGIDKEKMKLTFYGYISQVTLIIATNVVLPFFGIFFFQENSVLFTLFFIIPSYYAIQKYRFFSLSIAAYKILRKVFLLSGFVFVTFFLGQFFHELFGAFGYVSGILIGIFFYEAADSRFPRVISKTFKEFRNGVIDLKTSITSADSFERLQKAIENILVIRLNMTKAWICAIRTKQINKHIPFHTPDDFTVKLKRFTKDILILEEIPYLRISNGAKKTLREGMEALGCKICLPLSSEKNVIGFLALDYRDDINMTREIINELQELQQVLSVSYMNLLIKLNLQEENDLMKAIIDKKTELLKEKYKEIKELLRQQSDFIAITSHEIRTPLNVAILQANDLLESSRLSYSECEELTVVLDSLGKLKRFVQKLFDVQQFEFKKAKIRPEKFDISEFAKGIYQELKPVLSDKSIKLKFNDHIKRHRVAFADPAQLKQVLSNLISNASRFSEHGGIVLLECDVNETSLIFRVIDNGSGVPDDMKQSIFKKFRTQKGTGGLGLGLYISKKIIDLHKGKIWAEDNPEGGAIFAISLPLK